MTERTKNRWKVVQTGKICGEKVEECALEHWNRT